MSRITNALDLLTAADVDDVDLDDLIIEEAGLRTRLALTNEQVTAILAHPAISATVDTAKANPGKVVYIPLNLTADEAKDLGWTVTSALNLSRMERDEVVKGDDETTDKARTWKVAKDPKRVGDGTYRAGIRYPSEEQVAQVVKLAKAGRERWEAMTPAKRKAILAKAQASRQARAEAKGQGTK